VPESAPTYCGFPVCSLALSPPLPCFVPFAFRNNTIDTYLPVYQVFLEQLEGELESENPWERVVSLVDTQTEVQEDFKDTSRMTSILIQLKNEPLDSASTAEAS